jgi:hypothetical protein
MPSSGSNTNACPICGQPKTSWSLKCQACEGNRQRYLAAIERARQDKEFLRALEGRTLQSVADERHVSRQAIFLQKQKAERRVAFLESNPLPVMAPAAAGSLHDRPEKVAPAPRSRARRKEALVAQTV